MKLQHFTQEQIQEIAAALGIEYTPAVYYTIRDGDVTANDYVYWAAEDGPVYCKVDTHLDNLIRYPNLYSISKPEYTIRYTDPLIQE